MDTKQRKTATPKHPESADLLALDELLTEEELTRTRGYTRLRPKEHSAQHKRLVREGAFPP